MNQLYFGDNLDVLREHIADDSVTEAANAGFYDSPFGSKHPRLQILTVKELLAGRQIDYPRTNANVTFKKGDRYSGPKTENLQLGFDNE